MKRASTETLRLSVEERNRLVEEHLPLVRVMVRSKLANGVPPHIEADDMFQDVLVAVMAAVEQHQGRNGASMETFLRRVIADAMNMHIRKEMKAGPVMELPIEGKNVPLARPKPGGLGIDRRMMEDLLTAKQLQAVDAVYFVGFTQEEAAENLGIATRVLRVRLQRGLARLKNSFRPKVS